MRGVAVVNLGACRNLAFGAAIWNPNFAGLTIEFKKDFYIAGIRGRSDGLQYDFEAFAGGNFGAGIVA